MPDRLFNRRNSATSPLNGFDFGYPANVSPSNVPIPRIGGAGGGVPRNNAWTNTWGQFGVQDAPALGAGSGQQRGGIDWANWRGILFGETNPETRVQTNGALGTGLDLLQGGTNAYLAMRNYGLARRTLNENQRQFNLNYENQRRLTNAELSDRQRRRNIENPNSVPHDEYMNQWGL